MTTHVWSSLYDIRYESENLSDNQNSILTFAMGRKILFLHTKSYFENRYESENPNLIFKILIWHSLWVGKSYFDIRYEAFKNLFWHSHWVIKSYFDIQNPISTFAMSRKVLFWHLKSYFEIANVKKGFWMSKLAFPTHSEYQNRILNVKIGFSDS